MDKKLQVFVSSTYLDLKDERQKAVEGILRAGHIPAGMELFTAASKSQWQVIEEWIKESDLLMLILGGKYGSLEPETGKSYTQLEYEFAIKHEIPVFSIVLNDQYLINKKAASINLEVYEREAKQSNIEKYDRFKKTVLDNIVSFVGGIEEIPTEISYSLQEFVRKDDSEYKFRGWVRSAEVREAKRNGEKNERLFRMDEAMLGEVIDRLEDDDLIDIIEFINTYCAYTYEKREIIDDFVHSYTKLSKSFFNQELQKAFNSLLKSLEDYTTHLIFNFFPKNNRFHLHPHLNSDYRWVDEEGRKLYDKHLKELSKVSKETIYKIRNFVHDSRITLYK
ncbi:DUF4062 domain-containing protein [Bacillus sp. SB49]|uniref:DUF4062 domain-containing protein n=1 Tax=Bacillus sp. SB49 TaxID=1071080 RepID=UPI00040597B8|nr:DUF4062 domain-containing protein [Bacillus sp. SB49]QHT45585.1 DUF4062 domain-containing protein [Bacillus sp. SB49]